MLYKYLSIHNFRHHYSLANSPMCPLYRWEPQTHGRRAQSSDQDWGLSQELGSQVFFENVAKILSCWHCLRWFSFFEWSPDLSWSRWKDVWWIRRRIWPPPVWLSIECSPLHPVVTLSVLSSSPWWGTSSACRAWAQLLVCVDYTTVPGLSRNSNVSRFSVVKKQAAVDAFYPYSIISSPSKQSL